MNERMKCSQCQTDNPSHAKFCIECAGPLEYHCPNCGAVFHLESRPPRSAGTCDACGSALVQRPDDSEDVIRKRLEVYRAQTLPVATAYRGRDQLVELDGTGDADEVFARLQARLT